MNYIEIFFLALALSIDACVVSFSYGLKDNNHKNRFLLASFTGFFQGLMPLLGYFLTTFVVRYIAPYAKIIVLIIFLFLGIKFIKESFDEKQEPKCINLCCLFLIGIATSIDAFSAGISLLLSGNNIIKPVILISITTFINSNLGFILGTKIKKIPSQPLEILAGLILIFLGIKAVF